ncbi:DUF2268 domain-containing protein [Metabacillus sp. KIGAM252]|uniref:DUF2268 domain-containing protein n=1 Tax=Metabacillus flavus TaxID=2823519 RepID=A0ABS5LD76_9BACI|nr:DUF2268 domain-containing protein [Metabacillus flavus]MBS2968374.1 DUF2268 domain-containing protein [Metabacillus flavus]
MGVMRTDQWFEKELSLNELAKKLKPYFPDRSEKTLVKSLLPFGVYRNGQSALKTMQTIKEEKILPYINKEYEDLRKKWSGPDAPVFILPGDLSNGKIKREYGGKSGLAFHDKLFLFLAPDVPKEEVKALLIHEYHHICRLAKDPKKEKDYTLADVVIMEGLAENAVRELLGEDKTASWTRLYQDAQLRQFWKRHILPNQTIKQEDRHFDKMIYGLGMYPKMLGYTAGYYAVKSYMKDTGSMTESLFKTPSERIIKALKIEE